MHVDWTRPIAYAAVAGSATALGGALVLCFRGQPSNTTICFTLSFAAGVMMVVSVVDLWWPIASQGFLPFLGATFSILAGMVCTSYLSRLRIPEPEELLQIILAGGLEAGGGSSSGGGSSGSGRPSRDIEGPGCAEHEIINSSNSSSNSSSSSSSAGLSTSAGAGAAEGSSDKEAVALLVDSSSSSAAACLGEPGSASALPPSSLPSLPPGALDAKARSWRLGMLLALVLTVHNLPEGLAVGVSALKSKELGLALASAIFLHNVAEGVVIAVPLLAATGNRWLALGITAASGVSEPLGAALGVLLLRGVSAGSGETLELLINLVLCAVGGVMLQVSRSELLPQARRVGDGGTVTAGFLVGGALIGASLLLLQAFK
jgi:zinc transporter ZupT